MLIKIDRSVVTPIDNQTTLSKEVITMLELLALARKEGKHFIYADQPTLDSILKCENLSDKDKAIYDKIKADRELKLYLSSVTEYIEVINPCLVQKRVKDALNKTIIQVSPTFFNDSESIQKTILLCENDNDANFYQIIAKVYLFWLKQTQTRLPLVYEHRGGGGSTISLEYENIQKSPRLCLCILDSDKLAPDDNVGETAKQTQEKDQSDRLNTEIFILEVRESENLIGPGILYEICKTEDRKKAWETIDRIKKSSVQDISRFLDLKKDFLLKKTIAETSDTVRKFWQSKIPDIPDRNQRIDDWCLQNWQCSQRNQKPDCKCIISFGFGDKILENTVDWLTHNSEKNISERCDELLKKDWEKIGQKIINWCLGSSVNRA